MSVVGYLVMLGENTVCAKGGVGVETKRGGQQFVDVCPLEVGARAGLKMELCRIREFFACHDRPFFNATPNSGQTHTFKSPTTRLKEKLLMTAKQSLFLLVCK